MKKPEMNLNLNIKGLSTIISSVLMIMIILILAIIIYNFMFDFTIQYEPISVEIAGNEKRANEACLDIILTPTLNDDGTFGFSNDGNVPIYEYKVKLVTGSNSNIIYITKDEGGTLLPGHLTLIPTNKVNLHTDYDAIEIHPIIKGTKNSAEATFDCSETGYLHTIK